MSRPISNFSDTPSTEITLFFNSLVLSFHSPHSLRRSALFPGTNQAQFDPLFVDVYIRMRKPEIINLSKKEESISTLLKNTIFSLQNYSFGRNKKKYILLVVHVEKPQADKEYYSAPK